MTSVPRRRRRRRASARRRFALTLGSLFLVLLAAIALMEHHRNGRFTTSDAVVTADAPPEADAGLATVSADADRPVFPYSVVNGGARTGAELMAAINRDPIVARHFEAFDLANTTVVRLETPRVAHVSYRVGNDVFWTRKPVVIPAGETVLTDGRHFARTRCANQIAELPGAVSPLEPPAHVLDTPVSPAGASMMLAAALPPVSLGTTRSPLAQPGFASSAGLPPGTVPHSGPGSLLGPGLGSAGSSSGPGGSTPRSGGSATGSGGATPNPGSGGNGSGDPGGPLGDPSPAPGPAAPANGSTPGSGGPSAPQAQGGPSPQVQGGPSPQPQGGASPGAPQGTPAPPVSLPSLNLPDPSSPGPPANGPDASDPVPPALEEQVEQPLLPEDPGDPADPVGESTVPEPGSALLLLCAAALAGRRLRKNAAGRH